MALIIAVIEQPSITPGYSDYKYTFESRNDDGKRIYGHRSHSINYIAKSIMINPIKVQNTMKKMGGVNLKEEWQKSAWSNFEETYTYFKTKEEALTAKEWIDSMLLNLQMVGHDAIKQAQEEKSAQNKNKKIEKLFKKVLVFKGLDISIEFTTLDYTTNLKFDGTINSIEQKDTQFHIKFTNGEILGSYNKFSIEDGKLKYCGTNYEYSFKKKN